MEYLVLVGGLLSIPLIMYSTKPVPPPTVEKEPEKEVPVLNKTQSADELALIAQRSRERQEKVLSELNPRERELFKEYVQEMKNPERQQQAGFYKVIDCCMFLILVVAVGAIGLLLLSRNNKESIYREDL